MRQLLIPDTPAVLALLAAAAFAHADAPADVLRQHAAAGDTTAMRALAERYLSGDGAAKDYGQGMRWLVNAASAGDVAAMNRLSALYQQPGGGYPPNPAGAADWAEHARRVATLIPNQPPPATRPTTQATTQPATRPDELAELMFQRALTYINGRWVREDRRQALAWMLNAAEAGHAVAMRRVGNHYGGVGESKISADWYRRAAEAGDREAMTKLAALYDVGNGVPQDAALAKQWRDRATATAPGR